MSEISKLEYGDECSPTFSEINSEVMSDSERRRPDSPSFIVNYVDERGPWTRNHNDVVMLHNTTIANQLKGKKEADEDFCAGENPKKEELSAESVADTITGTSTPKRSKFDNWRSKIALSKVTCAGRCPTPKKGESKAASRWSLSGAKSTPPLAKVPMRAQSLTRRKPGTPFAVVHKSTETKATTEPKARESKVLPKSRMSTIKVPPRPLSLKPRVPVKHKSVESIITRVSCNAPPPRTPKPPEKKCNVAPTNIVSFLPGKYVDLIRDEVQRQLLTAQDEKKSQSTAAKIEMQRIANDISVKHSYLERRMKRLDRRWQALIRLLLKSQLINLADLSRMMKDSVSSLVLNVPANMEVSALPHEFQTQEEKSYFNSYNYTDM